MKYQEFLLQKSQLGGNHGFKPTFMPDFLFDFQKFLVEWSMLKGRGAIFADCGLGKTPIQLVWAQNIVEKTNKNVLILTPLAVSAQTIREGEKFNIECKRSSDGTAHKGITVTNYERLDKFDSNDFIGVVADESSILKNYDGKTKALITEFMRKLPYRLLTTATAAPNDYIELGTSSEALGYLGYMDMLNRFFKNDQNTSKPVVYRHKGQNYKQVTERAKWRLKGHAEGPFWRWVSSWARAVRKPSDIGFDDDKFLLPELTETEHLVNIDSVPEGKLFTTTAVGLFEQREERRRTIVERCEKVAELVSDTGKSALVWCHLNKEGDLLSQLIPGATQVSGGDSDESKEEKLLAFAKGELRVLVTKPKIASFGLNFQHCSHVTFFPSHSYEQYYQGIRRCWRFGQKQPVQIDIVTTEGEIDVLKNLQRKAKQADIMFSELMQNMEQSLVIDSKVNFDKEEKVPAWL